MNMRHASIQLFALLALIATFDTQRVQGQTVWVLNGYVCEPEQCLDIATGVGFFSGSITIIGTG